VLFKRASLEPQKWNVLANSAAMQLTTAVYNLWPPGHLALADSRTIDIMSGR